jgi:glycogen debranching enzyme
MDAFYIAKKDLLSLYKKYGIHTGGNHFTDYWARDSMYACFGAMSLANYSDRNDINLNHVRLNLELLSRYQNKNTGQVPVRVGSKYIFLKMLGLNDKSFSARYKQDKLFLHPFSDDIRPTDPNPLYVIVSCLYILSTKDNKFKYKYISNIKRAIEWCISRTEDNLIKEGPYCTWEDTVAKKGKVLYTNALFYGAIKSFIKILDDKKEIARYDRLAKYLKYKINSNYWKENYYIDWIDGDKKYDYFSMDGNLFAILFGIADKQKANKIQRFVDKKGLNDLVPSKTCYTKAKNNSYPEKHVSMLNRSVGMTNYHSRWMWIWLGSLDVIIKNKIGNKEKADKLFKKISSITIRDGVCHEVYNIDGYPVNFGIRFRSEAPSSWTAGMYLFAYESLKNSDNKFVSTINNLFS